MSNVYVVSTTCTKIVCAKNMFIFSPVLVTLDIQMIRSFQNYEGIKRYTSFLEQIILVKSTSVLGVFTLQFGVIFRRKFFQTNTRINMLFVTLDVNHTEMRRI